MCPEGETLSAYLDDELEFAWKERIKAHLESCPSCRRTCDELTSLTGLLHEDREPDYRASLNRLERKLAELKLSGSSKKEPVWKRKVSLPLPVAGVAAILMLLMGISLVMLSLRSDVRKMSIRKVSAGTLEIQVVAPIEDLELLLRALDKQDFAREIIINLPVEPQFIMIGEPEILRETEFSRYRKW